MYYDFPMGAAASAGGGGSCGSDEEEFDDTSIFENKAGLSDDMRFLASMPELCDITFLVGETREPVCAVKAVLGARSRVFQKLVYTTPKELPKEKETPMKAASKLRAFIKRSSEPLLNMQPQPRFTSSLSTVQETLIIEEFEPDVFRQLIEYIHTGCVTLQPRTLLAKRVEPPVGFPPKVNWTRNIVTIVRGAGHTVNLTVLGVMNAADYYGLDELKKACAGFIQCCVNVDTVCALLATAERYIQYKCTKSLVQKVLEFVDDHGNEVLNLGSFALLPQHVVRLILTREELKADEFSKFQAALMWSKKYCDSTNSSLNEVLGSFVEHINFHMIPANILMKEIHPLGLVPSRIIMKALAYQADPDSIEPLQMSSHQAGGVSVSRGGASRPRRGGDSSRSMSVQSSKGPFGSSTTLSSSNSSAGIAQMAAADTLSVDAHSTHSPSRCSSVSRYST